MRRGVGPSGPARRHASTRGTGFEFPVRQHSPLNTVAPCICRVRLGGATRRPVFSAWGYSVTTKHIPGQHQTCGKVVSGVGREPRVSLTDLYFLVERTGRRAFLRSGSRVHKKGGRPRSGRPPLENPL